MCCCCSSTVITVGGSVSSVVAGAGTHGSACGFGDCILDLVLLGIAIAVFLLFVCILVVFVWSFAIGDVEEPVCVVVIVSPIRDMSLGVVFVDHV